MQRYLFLIRGKLGDSLVAYSVLRDFMARHPDADVTVIVRRNYLPLLAPAPGQRYALIPYRGRVQCWWAVFQRRCLQGRWDVFAVLWGTGKNLAALARASGASRRIYLDGRYAPQFPEYPASTPHVRQVDPAWRVANVLDPDMPKPQKLVLDALALRWQVAPQRRAIGVCPLSEESRRNFDPETLGVLLQNVARKHPECPIYILLNPGDDWVLPPDLPQAAQPKAFHTLDELVDLYLELQHWYGTDTGLYHLAAGMGIPCTEFFGPTVPAQNAMPEQDNRRVRLRVLDDRDCDIKNCDSGDCLKQAVRNDCGVSASLPLAAPPSCPLYAADAGQLKENATHESPAAQAR